MFNIIKSIYNNVKSFVTIGGESSALFDCQVGLREGEILSPILFSFYVNDLCSYLHNMSKYVKAGNR